MTLCNVLTILKLFKRGIAYALVLLMKKNPISIFKEKKLN